MGWRRFLVVGVLLAGGCASARTADEPVPEVMLPAVPATVPTTAASTTIPPVSAVATPSPQTCVDDPGGVDPATDIPIDDWVVAAERLGSGDVRLVATAPTGERQGLGCMSGDTADASIELGLSLASVAPVAEGVRVAIAVPAGRQLGPLTWLAPRDGAASADTSAGFDV